MTDLPNVLAALRSATCPEDVFGTLGGTRDAKLRAGRRIHRKLVFATHTDHQPAEVQAEAAEAFRLMTEWWRMAQEAIQDGTYGSRTIPFRPITLTSRTGAYVLRESKVPTTGRIALVYNGQDKHRHPVLVRIASSPVVNDFLEAEHQALLSMHGEADKVKDSLLPSVPRCLDSFLVAEPGKSTRRRVNVLTYLPDLVSVQEIQKAYPDGIDARDMVWMWKRLLGVLYRAHSVGLVHANCVPDRMLLHLGDHGGAITDWSFAVKTGTRARAVIPEFLSLYPPEVAKKLPVGPATDLYMVAALMLRLCPTMPKRLGALAKACLQDRLSVRLDDAIQVHRMIDDLLEPLFGIKKFRRFALPAS